MVDYNKPDFAETYHQANTLLVKSTVAESFPVSITAIIKEQSNICCVTYQKAITKWGFNPAALGSKSALYVPHYYGKKIIFYNDKESESRKRFSLGHEFGHYWLEHDLDTKDPVVYAKQEVETNFFTAQLFMPEQILRELQKRLMRIDEAFLINTFNVSAEAARKRLVTLNKLQNYHRSALEQEYDDIILSKYKSFIDKIRPVGYSQASFAEELERQAERDCWFQDRKERW